MCERNYRKKEDPRNSLRETPNDNHDCKAVSGRINCTRATANSQCRYCDAQFNRSEHFKRHERSRPFPIQVSHTNFKTPERSHSPVSFVACRSYETT